jgi:hypothetical protein
VPGSLGWYTAGIAAGNPTWDDAAFTAAVDGERAMEAVPGEMLNKRAADNGTALTMTGAEAATADATGSQVAEEIYSRQLMEYCMALRKKSSGKVPIGNGVPRPKWLRVQEAAWKLRQLHAP